MGHRAPENTTKCRVILAQISISAASPDSRADFCNKLSPTNLNFGPISNPNPISWLNRSPFSNKGRNVLRILDGFRQPRSTRGTAGTTPIIIS